MQGFVKLAALAAVASVASSARANLIVNPSFEQPALAAGDTYGAQGWNAFNGAYTIKVLPHTGAQALKVFGLAGVFQDFAAAEGQTWAGSVWAANPSFDPMGLGQVAAVNIEWLDAAKNQLSFLSTPILVGAVNPANDTYVLGNVAGVAPAGTAFARLTLITGNFAEGAGGGAPFFDDASFDQVVPEPASLAALGAAGAIAATRRRRRR